MNSREYWAEIKDLAEDAITEARHYDEDPYERLRETIDGHSWVIYYAKAVEILQHTDNGDAIWEEFGDTQSNEDGMFDCRRAYCAMMADVLAHSAWDPEPEEDPDADDTGEEGL